MPSGLSRLVLLSVLLVGCTARRVKREDLAALVKADAQVAQGCFDCLLEARTTYERLAKSKYVQVDSVARRLFETELVLSLRAKELQLDWRRSQARAESLAMTVRTVDAARVLAIADAVVPDGSGRMNDWNGPFVKARAGFAKRVPEDVRWLQTAPLSVPVREYLALALDCSYDAKNLAPRALPGTNIRRPVLLPDATPLVMYRTAICLSADTNMLAAVLVHEPRFHEAAYFAGMMAAFRSEEDGGGRAAALLAQAFSRFPRSPAIAYISGWNAMNVNDCVEAKRFFDAAVAIDPVHEFGLLHGTVCRSRLREDSAAIAHASRLIALNSSSTQQGYYWRAVSKLRLRDLESARADIEVAKGMEREANALTMAGVIENEQNDLPIAEADLREARDLPRGDSNCTAAWTLGLVIAKTSRPGDAADAFEGAMACYDLKLAIARAQIRRLQASPPRDPDFARRRLEAMEADSLDQRRRYHASAFNAAGNRANAGNIARALELLEVASQDATLADPVEKLRSAIAAARVR